MIAGDDSGKRWEVGVDIGGPGGLAMWWVVTQDYFFPIATEWGLGVLC